MVLVLGFNFFTVAVEVLPGEHATFGLPFLLIGYFLYYLGILMTSRYNQNLYQLDKMVWLQYAILVFSTIILLIAFHHYLTLIAAILVASSFMMLIISFRHRNRVEVDLEK
ncbi:hypothetical protein [Streptococcus suis]|uniref:hypothetical protein n=1 Tax=Streptococcus suis TaxID=1307 RepID=UPI0037D8BF21